jgi:hypothetical protein
VRTEEVPIPDSADLSRAESPIERCFADVGLDVTLKGALAAHKGSIHWHLKHGKERGTLEATLWPARRRLWLSVHANRGGEWVDEVLRRLIHALPEALDGATGATARAR